MTRNEEVSHTVGDFHETTCTTSFLSHMATTILALLRWVQQLNNGVQRFPSKLSLNSNLTFIDAGGGCSLALRVVRMRFQPFKCDYNLFIISI